MDKLWKNEVICCLEGESALWKHHKGEEISHHASLGSTSTGSGTTGTAEHLQEHKGSHGISSGAAEEHEGKDVVHSTTEKSAGTGSGSSIAQTLEQHPVSGVLGGGGRSVSRLRPGSCKLQA